MKNLLPAAVFAVLLVVLFLWILGSVLEPRTQTETVEYEDWVSFVHPSEIEGIYPRPLEDESDIEFIIRHGIESSTGFAEAKLVVLDPGLPIETKAVIEKLGKPVRTTEEWDSSWDIPSSEVLWILKAEYIPDGAIYQASYGRRLGPKNCGKGTIITYGRNFKGVLTVRSRGGWIC